MHTPSPYDPGGWGQNSKFLANILPADPSPPLPILGMGSIGQNSTFSEHDHVEYQIKRNNKCSNLVANSKPADPPPPPVPRGLKVKIQLFQNMVMLHNKLKEMEYRAHAYTYYHPLNLWVALKVKKSVCSHVAYQIKGKEVWTNIEANTLTIHTPLTDWRNEIYVCAL